MTATNPNVNIVQWFGDNIFGDLQAAAGGGVHPALQVDAIRYLYTFRYQVRFASSTRVCYLNFLSPATAHEGTTGLGVTAAIESPRVAGSRGVHVRCSGARSHPVYACWSNDDAHVRLPSHRLDPSLIFVGFHPWTYNRSRRSFSTSSSRRSESRTTRSARRRTTSLCVVRVPFRSLRVGASSVVFPQVLLGLSSLLNKRSSGST